jgi:hypothetical protein
MASISYSQTPQNVFDYAPNQENEQKVSHFIVHFQTGTNA